MTVWFDNPMELFREDKVKLFWPTPEQSKDERINATTRFIIYTTSILFVIKRDLRVPLFAAMMIALSYFLDKNNTQPRIVKKVGNPHPKARVGDCQRPTKDNPMANVLLSDYVTEPNRPPACPYDKVKDEVHELVRDTIPYDCGRSRCPMPEQQQYAAARQFITGPVTTIPGDQTAFAEWCYGKKFQPLCRNDQSKCDPDFRGAQLDAFAGLDSAMNPRTGMRGGTV
jgi:hypothetical protein